MKLAVHRAGAGDLAGVVDRGGFLEHPARSGRDHGVQVLHLCAICRDERVIGVIRHRR